MRVFRRTGTTLTEIGSSLTLNAPTQTANAGVTAGQQIVIWVYGYNFSTGFDDLAASIA